MANIIITNISLLKTDDKSRSEKNYNSDLCGISGINTNDAPVKYLIKLLAVGKQPIDKIIAVTTKEAEPALETFEDTINSFTEELNIPCPLIEKVSTSENEFSQTIKEVTEKFTAGDKAFIDTTGGFRNSSYFLMCVVRMLEYSGVKLEKAVYSRFDNYSINDITDIYRKYDLINAVDIFTKFGNSYELEQYFSNTDEPAVKEVISAMNAFSDMISLCRTSELSSILEKLNISLVKLSSTHSDSADTILFQSLICTIREKFYMKNNCIEYPDIVRWCLDNRLIQQAVTIYVERMPEFFYKKGLFCTSDEILENLKEKNTKSHFDFYYEMFYNNLMTDSNKNVFYNFLSDVIKNSDGVYSELFNKLQYDSLKKIVEKIPTDKYDIAKLEKPLRRLLKTRYALYNKGRRKEKCEYEKPIKENPEIWKYVENTINTIPKEAEAFIKNTAKNAKLCRLFADSDPCEYEDMKIIFIESISESHKNKKFSLNEKLSAEKLQTIFRDILYAKQFIRNKLNHASDEESESEELQNYFSAHGYNVGCELNVKEIKDFMAEAIDNIRSCCNEKIY